MTADHDHCLHFTVAELKSIGLTKKAAVALLLRRPNPKRRAELIAQQEGRCAIDASHAITTADSELDHVQTVDFFAGQVAHGKMGLVYAFEALHDIKNARATCKPCNRARTRKADPGDLMVGGA